MISARRRQEEIALRQKKARIKKARLLLKELLQPGGAFEIDGVGRVVQPAVGEHAAEVGREDLREVSAAVCFSAREGGRSGGGGGRGKKARISRRKERRARGEAPRSVPAERSGEREGRPPLSARAHVERNVVLAGLHPPRDEREVNGVRHDGVVVRHLGGVHGLLQGKEQREGGGRKSSVAMAG